MYQKAGRNADAGNFASALKLYCFAMLLMNSLPEENILYQDISFTTDIPEKINGLIDATRFTLVEDRKISAKERKTTVKI
jgi:hypothetical protein